MASRSLEMATEVRDLLRARNHLLWIVTREEKRVQDYLAEAAVAAAYVPRFWDCAAGVTDMTGNLYELRLGLNDPGAMLAFIEGKGLAVGRNIPAGFESERGAWIMRDLGPWISGSIGMITVRALRNLATRMRDMQRDSAQAIIVMSATADVPPELSDLATVVEWPMPDRIEIATILDQTLAKLPDELRESAITGSRDAVIDAALGLSGREAGACYAKSLSQTRTIDVKRVVLEKKRVIAKEGILEWFDPLPDGLDAVGGLDNLKSWLVSRRLAYSPEARAYGLPAPKGAMLVGIPGCGKSLTAKAVATGWSVPLLRVDLNALKSKFVGESEANLRRALRVIEAIGRCVVWLDEIEKALAGSTDGSADGGVSSDALGTILSWMQERRGEAFVIATANDVSKLPPELMRKGRFDEIWAIDLPNTTERSEVLRAALRSHGRGNSPVDHASVAAATVDFTGAEVAAMVPDAMFIAFADGARDVTTADLLTAAKSVVPLAKMARDKIKTLRKWAAENARPATAPQVRTDEVIRSDMGVSVDF